MQDTNQPEVLSEAERTLAEFKASFETVYEQSSSIFETAKDLYQKILAIVNEGKIRVEHEEMTVFELDAWLQQLLKPEKAKWGQLIEGEEILEKKVNTIYDPVKEAEAAMIHARGEGLDVAFLGMTTVEQDKVRFAYNHKFLKEFAEAKVEYEGLLGYPDGILLRVRALKKGAETVEKEVLAKLHHIVESHAGAHGPHLEVLDEADATLALYKPLFEVAYEKSTSLFRTAKILYEQVHDVLNAGKLRVLHGEWTVDEFEGYVLKLQDQQKSGWEKLLAEGEKLRQKVDEAYEPVRESEAKVRHTIEPPNVAMFGHLTDDQATVKKVYHNKLKNAFAVAKFEYEGLCGFPDGLITRVPHLKNGAEMEAHKVIDNLRHREHRPKIFRIPVPSL